MSMSATGQKMAKTRNGAALTEGPKLRTTLMISEDIDRMVEVCAAVEGKQKSEVVNEALAAYFVDKEKIRSLSKR